MSIRVICLSGIVAIFAATSALPADHGSGPLPAKTEQQQQQQIRPHHGGMRLPVQLKLMWRREEHGHVRGLPADQRRGWMRVRWAAMNEQQKRAKIAELQAKWDALPENVRHTLIEKKHERRAQRMNNMSSPRHGRARAGHAAMQQSP